MLISMSLGTDGGGRGSTAGYAPNLGAGGGLGVCDRRSCSTIRFGHGPDRILVLAAKVERSASYGGLGALIIIGKGLDGPIPDKLVTSRPALTVTKNIWLFILCQIDARGRAVFSSRIICSTGMRHDPSPYFRESGWASGFDSGAIVIVARASSCIRMV